MSYDQGYWHTDHCNDQKISEDNAGTHIAAYVKWCLMRNLLADVHDLAPDDDLDKKFAAEKQEVRSGSIPANTYFEKYFDWKFGEWNLTDEGNDFTRAYYDKYLQDLDERFPSIIYGDETAIEWDKLFKFLDTRLSEFRDLGAKGVPWGKRWWRFW